MTTSIVGSSMTSAQQGRTDSSAASVLLIEDERELSDEVRLELEGEGYSVRVAYNVEERASGGALRLG